MGAITIRVSDQAFQLCYQKRSTGEVIDQWVLPQTNLSLGMRQLNEVYTQRLNRRAVPQNGQLQSSYDTMVHPSAQAAQLL